MDFTSSHHDGIERSNNKTMSTVDTLLPAEVDEVPTQPTLPESLEEQPQQHEANNTNAAPPNEEKEPLGQGQAQVEPHMMNQEEEPSLGTTTLSSHVSPLNVVPGDHGIEHHPPAPAETQGNHFVPYNYTPSGDHATLPADTNEVMKDAGTDLSTNVATGSETTAEGLNLKHDADRPTDQEMQAMEQAVMAEASMTTDSAMPPPPIKKRRIGSKRSSVRPWNDMLYELLKYRMTHGHVMVPFKTGGDLGKWVSQQRTQYANVQKTLREKPVQSLTNSEYLTEERMRVLTSIGFVWDVVQADNDARWKKRYDELKTYRLTHGHCNVPQSTDLGKWVKMQRENKHEADLKKTGATPLRKKPKPCLSDERIAKLEAIGFQWRVAKPAVGWDKRYQQLIEYKKIHGDCNVPQSYPPDKPFGRWVMKQRCQHSLKLRGEKSQLTDEREQKLNAIDFSWVAPGFSKKTVNMPGDPVEMNELQAAQVAVQPGAAEEQELPVYAQHPAMHHHPHADFTWTV